MGKTEAIRSRLKQFLPYDSQGSPERVPEYLHVIEWIGFAQQYNEAANTLSQHNESILWPPRALLSGHALECALKACLLSKGTEAPRDHDLVNLSDMVIDLGFVLYEPELAAIVHLNSVFFMDLVTLTKFKVRYPADFSEATTRSRVPQSFICRIVESLVLQAGKVNDFRNREAWSGVRGDAQSLVQSRRVVPLL
ncbi:MAG: HEPN domain-containing protein [Bradymonadaceae bacterium]|nr:HEPN domain-containing protein [Lujinxingiaceae bacterium]